MPKYFVLFVFIILLSSFSFAQEGPPPPPPMREDKFDQIDQNHDGAVSLDEFKADSARIFESFDQNHDGVIDESELMNPPPREEPPRGGEPRNGQPPPERRDDGFGRKDQSFGRDGNKPHLPPFFKNAEANGDGKITRAEFDADTPNRFAEMDKNHDGVLSRDEMRRPKDDRRREDQPPPPQGNAPTIAFLGAEMRFGDKLVKNAPFSADIVLESVRRLYDGSTVTKQSKGAIYRDGEGRTRREQPLDSIGAFKVTDGQKLIFINDPVENVQYFVDTNRKSFTKKTLRENEAPKSGGEPREGGNAKKESLGTKIIEGVSAEGTRTTIEIPAELSGSGNGKTLQVVSERWYSPELQTVVMSRHVDPFQGEQVFRLENIKRSEPTRELFTVPADYKVENSPKSRGEGKRPDNNGEGRRPDNNIERNNPPNDIFNRAPENRGLPQNRIGAPRGGGRRP